MPAQMKHAWLGFFLYVVCVLKGKSDYSDGGGPRGGGGGGPLQQHLQLLLPLWVLALGPFLVPPPPVPLAGGIGGG